jgi:hypothetical protein
MVVRPMAPFFSSMFSVAKKNYDDNLCYRDGTNTVDREDKDLVRTRSSTSSRYLRIIVCGSV